MTNKEETYMVLKKFKQTVSRNLINIPGWRTNRKIIVIESDDWGAIRMPSLEVRERLINKGVKFSNYGYDEVDTLASREDLTLLFDLLSKYKDINGNHPVITTNAVMANPDFTKIEAADYREYHYELFTDTLNRYYGNDDVFELWKEGMRRTLFYPQFHAREHLNVQMWLNSLCKNHDGVRTSFNDGVFSGLIKEDNRKKFMHSYNICCDREKSFIEESIRDGLSIFERIFGHKSLSAIAPSYTWDPFVEKIYYEEGVKYIQGGSVQVTSSNNGRGVIRHYTGQRNDFDQIYFVRNASFEPSQHRNMDNVASCMTEIANSFLWGKPAIISAHRLNFIGTLKKSNRDNTLIMFDNLLQQIVKKYPNVEFMPSDRLGQLMEE